MLASDLTRSQTAIGDKYLDILRVVVFMASMTLFSKPQRLCSIFTLGGLLSISSLATSSAALTITLEGTAGSTMVTTTFSGSGTWASSGTTFNLGATFNGFGDFVDSAINPSPDSGALFAEATYLAPGAITILNNGSSHLFSPGLYIDDNGVNDRLFLVSGSLPRTVGQTWSISGTAVFDLSLIDNPDIGASATFDAFTPGSYSNTFAGFPDPGFGLITVNIVPEPSSSLLASAGLIATGFYRRRKITKAS